MLISNKIGFTMQKPTILIVDDGPDIVDLLNDYLQQNNFSILNACDGEEALQKLTEKSVDLIISDISMPKLGGIELLKKIRENNQKTKFILMTGFSETLEMKSAFDLGADDFISKPFKLNELQAKINKLLDINTTKEVSADDDSTYKELSLEKFVEGRPIPHPIFLKLATNRYIKIAHEGRDIHESVIQKYKEKGIFSLYIKKEDYDRYLLLANKALLTLSKKEMPLPKDKRTTLLKEANIIIVDHLFSKTINEDLYIQTEELFNKNMSAITEDMDWMKLAQSFSETSKTIYGHSLCVTFFSLMLAKKLIWSSESNLIYLSLGAMFHDIGRKMLPASLESKYPATLTKDEIKELQRHPILGAEILRKMRNIPETVIQVVLQHHENHQGTGYPYGIPKHKIHPLSKIVAISNTFINLTDKVKGENIESRYKNAFTELLLENYNNFDSQTIKGLVNIFNFGPDLAKEVRPDLPIDWKQTPKQE